MVKGGRGTCTTRIVMCEELFSAMPALKCPDSLDIHPARVCNRCYLSLKKAKDDNGGMSSMIEIPSWQPHTESCPLCLRCAEESVGGRPRKRKPDVSSRDLADIRRVKSFLRVVNSLELPQTEDFLDDSHFLQSLILRHLSCKVCCCVSFQLVELLTCRHFLCKLCIMSACKEGEVVCPCNMTPLQEDELCVPSQLTLYEGVHGSDGVQGPRWTSRVRLHLNNRTLAIAHFRPTASRSRSRECTLDDGDKRDQSTGG